MPRPLLVLLLEQILTQPHHPGCACANAADARWKKLPASLGRLRVAPVPAQQALRGAQTAPYPSARAAVVPSAVADQFAERKTKQTATMLPQAGTEKADVDENGT